MPNRAKRNSLTGGGLLALLMLTMFAGMSACAPDDPPKPPTEPSEETTPAPSSDVVPNDAKSTLPASDSSTDEPTGDLPTVNAIDNADLAALLEETAGKITVLNIWATWCPPCVEEMPDLVQFYQNRDAENVAFLSISIDGVSAMDAKIPQFQRKHEIPFPIYVLNERDQTALQESLRGPFDGVIPVTFIYDRTGKRVQDFKGLVHLTELEAALRPLLSTEE